MATQNYIIFETELGWLGLAWNEAAITRLFMPEREAAAIERRLAKFDPAAVKVDEAALPEFVIKTIDQLKTYARGDIIDFSDTPVSAGEVGEMREAIYATLRNVGHGQTLTYGELAKRAGYPGMAREIGEAMGKNPVPIIVPCHRVLAAGGKIGGFSAPGGSRTKEKLLELEGARIAPPPVSQGAFSF